MGEGSTTGEGRAGLGAECAHTRTETKTQTGCYFQRMQSPHQSLTSFNSKATRVLLLTVPGQVSTRHKFGCKSAAGSKKFYYQT